MHDITNMLKMKGKQMLLHIIQIKHGKNQHKNKSINNPNKSNKTVPLLGEYVQNFVCLFVCLF